MKTLKRTAGFVLFALVLEVMWILLRVDVLEDLNVFGETRCWPWLIGAVVLFVLLVTAAPRIRRPLARNGWIFGTLAALLGIGLLVPRLIGGDGLAIGMFQFLNSYWILTVAAYWGALACRARHPVHGKG